MDTFQACIEVMNRSVKAADHLIYVTYPLVKEEKLILASLQNLNGALIAAVEAVLHYERLYKRIGPYPENFNSKLEIFKTKCAERYSIGREFIVLIQDVAKLVEEHKSSPMEFTRKNKYYIFNRDYRRMEYLDVNKLKSYISNAKIFIEKINRIYPQNVSRNPA